MDVDEQREAEWEATKRDYAQPNSDVDIGNMYYWAGYWHERYKAALTHERAQKQPVADVLPDVVAEYLRWREVNPHIKGGENYIRRLRGALTATKPVADETTYVAMPADAANPHAHAALTTMQQPSQGVSEWQPIETAPKDGTPVLTYASAPERPSAAMTVLRRRMPDSSWKLVQTGGYAADADPYAEPTHWMPLPTPPAGVIKGV